MARDVLTSADENTVEVTDATERGGLNIAKEEKGGVGTDSFSSGKAGKPGVEGKEGVEDGGGENGIRLATCHITVQTQTLVEMAYQTLMEISGSDDQKCVVLSFRECAFSMLWHRVPVCSNVQILAAKGLCETPLERVRRHPPCERLFRAIELFYCARDLFDLFRAVVPVHRARELENSLTSSVLFYNDCTYIVHHLITMGYQFKPRLLPPLNQTATMVDMIPAFRRLGQGCFRAQMVRVDLLLFVGLPRDLLLEALRSADGFGNTDSDDRFDKVERAIGRCTYQLTEISNNDLQLILPLELYLKSLGILLGSALEAVIGEVLKLECTRAEELHQLRYLCGMFSHTACTGGWFCISKMASGSGGTAAGMRKIVQKVRTAGGNGGGRRGERRRQQPPCGTNTEIPQFRIQFPVAKYCSAWAKFEACCELLEVSAEEFADRRRGALKEHFLDAELDRLFKVLHPSKAKMKSQRVPVG
ncbi:MAG: Centromere/kinetochore Zw10-domain-containing protein [Olpidium bornovanus]|uniref:Centromere/kinetochore Zw10-domain-containing protein n=1 Tax=Olpidium bornovanus TaxID=278681 RepID=A0A8H8DF65_9FUNG|nr:MAG: Centromere/kinetochore Zw10-domain-containing protein [Olpidium bornovanus]